MNTMRRVFPPWSLLLLWVLVLNTADYHVLTRVIEVPRAETIVILLLATMLAFTVTRINPFARCWRSWR